jgi:hypothetical protein
MDGPSFTCYTAVNKKYNPISDNYDNPGVMYATSGATESIEYTEKKGDKRRIFYHPHINFDHNDPSYGKKGMYGKIGEYGKPKTIDVNIAVFHELMHNCGYDHDENQCEYAYPCGTLCGRDMKVDPDFLRLCSHPPTKRKDTNYIKEVKNYFSDMLNGSGLSKIPTSDSQNK